MYPVIKTVLTKGTFKIDTPIEQTGLDGKKFIARWEKSNPCVHREDKPFYVACTNCEKFMSKSEIGYERYRLASYTWLANKFEEIHKEFKEEMKKMPQENERIMRENEEAKKKNKELDDSKSTDARIPIQQKITKESLEEKRDNKLYEAKLHGRPNWLRHQLLDLIKLNEDVIKEKRTAVAKAKLGYKVDESLLKKGIICADCQA